MQKQCFNFSLFLFFFYFLLANRGGIWCPTSGDSETRAAPERLRTKYSNPKYYTHLVHPGVGLICPTVLKDRETGLSANSDLTVVKELLKDNLIA
jgi:hypothetical protein